MAEEPRGLHTFVEPLIELGDQLAHVVVAVLFLLAAMLMIGHAVVSFVQNPPGDFTLDVLNFVNSLLLVLIILEVLSTVRGFLGTGVISLRPFLYIGIISATRRILAIGAKTTLESFDETTFRHLMIDLGINGLVVLALALALYLFSRPGAAAPEEHEENDRWH